MKNIEVEVHENPTRESGTENRLFQFGLKDGPSHQILTTKSSSRKAFAAAQQLNPSSRQALGLVDKLR